MLRKSLLFLLLLSLVLTVSGVAGSEEQWDASKDNPVYLTEEETLQLLASISDTPLLAASGAGAWEGHLQIHADGTFTGDYQDEDAEAVYASSFSGTFSTEADVVGNTYWLWVEELRTEQVPGTTAMKDGIRIVYDQAPIYERSYMVLTLPGTPDNEIPEQVKAEIGGVYGEWEDYSRFITLTNLEDGWGFFADPADPPYYDPEPAETAAPAPTAVPTPEPTASAGLPNRAALRGYWMTRDGSMAEMVINDNADGTFRAKAMFLPVGDSEATLTQQDDGSLRFENQYGTLKGLMVPQQDGTLRLSITGGSTMEDEEATEYQGYFAQGFTYYPAAYADMWYQTPEDAAGAEDDWLGIWSVMGRTGNSRLIISRKNGGLHAEVSFGSLHFSGECEVSSDTEMDLYADDFGCMLILNRKLKRIAMLEPWASDEELYNWVGNPYSGVIVYQKMGFQGEAPISTQAPADPRTTGKTLVLQTPVPSDSSNDSAPSVQSGDPWIGSWVAQGMGHTVRMEIQPGDMCDYFADFTFDDDLFLSGQLAYNTDEIMDVLLDDYISEFMAQLTLDAGKDTIVMDEIDCAVGEINSWLGYFDAKLNFVRGEAGSPAAPPVQSSSLIPVPGRSDVMQVPVISVDATSYIVGKDPTAYIPERMTDGEETTAFQFSTKKTKLGKAYLTFVFENPATVDELWMKNGFWKISDGKDQYTRNSRVKKMTIEVQLEGESGYRTLKTVSLKDDKARKDWTVIDMQHAEHVTAVRIRVDSIYKGSKYPNDVCISEMMFISYAK